MFVDDVVCLNVGDDAINNGKFSLRVVVNLYYDGTYGVFDMLSVLDVSKFLKASSIVVEFFLF